MNLVQTADLHYENTPIQHTAIFHARKNDYFHLKMFETVKRIKLNLSININESINNGNFIAVKF